ncbi:MAG: PQQ-binding-like beta-propeller repeat protein [Fimbriimonadaceae bacterium]|nr:PQQ-binding-like beta-propeller repeat protein [Fimbriimonadaceae bacterium]
MQTLMPSPAFVLSGATGPVQTLAFSENGHLVVGGDTNRVLTAWVNGQVAWQRDLRSKQAKVRATERIRSVAFSRDGASLYVASGDRLRALDALNGEELWHYEPPRAWCFLVISPNCVTVTADERVVCCLENGAIGIWDRRGRRLQGWTHNDGPRYIGLLPDGKLAGTDRFSLCLWDLETEAEVAKVTPTERLHAFACSPIENLVATRSLHAVDVWEGHDLRQVAAVPIQAGTPLLVASPSSPLFAYSETGVVRVIDRDGQGLMNFPEEAVSLAFNPLEPEIAVGRRDGTIAIWPLMT